MENNILQIINSAVKAILEKGDRPSKVLLTNHHYQELLELTGLDEITNLVSNNIAIPVKNKKKYYEIKNSRSLIYVFKMEQPLDLEVLANYNQPKEPLIWYDELSCGNWITNELKKNGFSSLFIKPVVELISKDYANQLQRAFAKGWEQAYNDARKTIIEEYVYYPKELKEVESLNQQQKETTRTATITLTPDAERQIKIEKGAVSTYEIANMLQASQQILAKMLVEEYIELTGDKEVDPGKFEDWIIFLRENKI